jgi:phosphoglycerate dehydrogenase-like enzyme
MPTRVAILDDYQGVALSMADWSSLGAGVSLHPFRERIGGEDGLAKRLRNFDVIAAMRERTPFPASLIERLPVLKLLVTTGRRNAAIDVKTVHVVLSDRTRGVVSSRELALMKPSAFLVNTAWGPIVDEQALIHALRHSVISGAGLDVLDEEPLPAAHPLRRLEQVLLTPHLGYVTMENYRLAYGEAVEDIRAFLAGAPVRVLA